MKDRVTWVGLGRMGLPMAVRLHQAGHEVRGVEPDTRAAARAQEAGIPVLDLATALEGSQVVFTMLPSGSHVTEVLGGPSGVLATAAPGVAVVDCSTIDILTAQQLHRDAAELGRDFLDAPVSGGVGGAETGTLTFMVGGTDTARARLSPIIEHMAKRVISTGSGGTGQAAKIVNNQIFGVCLAATCEGALLAERLGLDASVFYDIASSSTSDNFVLRTWYPVPGVLDSSPSSRGYTPGFTNALLLKDLRLAAEAAAQTGTPVAATAATLQLFEQIVAQGDGDLDCTFLYAALDRSQ